MEKRNIYTDVTENLQFHEDDRGKIADIFYNHPIEHITFLTTKKGAIRGNHYHKLSTQHLFLIKGALEYWSMKVDSSEPATKMLVVPGDIVTSKSFEIHTIRATEDCEFIALSEGVRGGKDYESDTFRVESIILDN